MFLFKRKKFNMNSFKLDTIQRIERAEVKLTSFGLAKITLRLDKIVNYLDDKSLQISEEQANMISACISEIEGHMGKQYEALLIKKCEHTMEAIKGEITYEPHTLVKQKNETRLYEMLGELGLIEDEIRIIEKKMDDSLGKDRNLWNMLKAQKQELMNRARVINKNYQSLLEGQNALSVAETVKKAKLDAEELMRQSNMPNMLEFEENAEFTSLATDDVHESNERMQTVFDKTFGGVDDTFEYERALEKKLMENELNFEPSYVGSKSTSDTY